jgi:hypothetical protein
MGVKDDFAKYRIDVYLQEKSGYRRQPAFAKKLRRGAKYVFMRVF